MNSDLAAKPAECTEYPEGTRHFRVPYMHLAFLIAMSAFLAGLLRHVTGHIAWGAIYIFFGLAASALTLYRIRAPLLSYVMILGVVLGFLVMGLSSINDQGLRPLFLLLIMLSAALLARLMVDTKTTFIISASALAIVSVLIAYQFMRHGISPAAYNEVFAHASRNRLGAFLLITAVATTVGYYQDRGGFIVSPSLVALFLSLPLYGRSTIAGALALLVVVLVARFSNKKVVLTIFLFGAAFLGMMFLATIWDWVVASTNFGRSLESPRWTMFHQYFTNLEAVNVVFGLPLDEVALIRAYDGNPHNSFIRLHSMYGAAGIVIVLLGLVLFFLRSGLFLMAMMAILVARIAMDTVALGDYLDHFIFAIFIIGIRGNAMREISWLRAT